jgi:hypothetical protein
VDSDFMSEAVSAAAENPYAVPLEALEQKVQVSPAVQISEESHGGEGAADWAWDEQRRQAQLAGGA